MGTDVAGGNEIWRTLSLKLPGVYRFFPCSRRVSKPGGPRSPPGLLRFARLQSALGSLPSVALSASGSRWNLWRGFCAPSRGLGLRTKTHRPSIAVAESIGRKDNWLDSPRMFG